MEKKYNEICSSRRMQTVTNYFIANLVSVLKTLFFLRHQRRGEIS
jgi:hypothetical protein